MKNPLASFIKLVLPIVLNFCLLSSVNAQFDPLVVDRIDDRNDPGVTCDTTVANDCSLREAINLINSVSPPSTQIEFDQIVFGNGGTIILTNQLTITKNATITQTSTVAPVIINADNNSRIFTIGAGITVTLTKLRLINGAAGGNNGGAILNNGSLNVILSTIHANNATQGGGIYNNGGTLTLNSSTISQNAASSGGGGIYNFNGNSGGIGRVTLTNTTVSGNSGGIGFGGGYFGFASDGTTTLTATNVTVANNSASNGGGIAISSISGTASTANLNNTIVGDNTANATANDNDGPDVFNNPALILPPPLNSGVIIPGTFSSSNYNLIEITTAGGITLQSNDRTGDPELEPLADNNFVFAASHALRNATGDKSPAIDAGNTGSPTDQRGFSRDIDILNAPDPPDADNINDDIGAFEVQLAPSAAIATISGRFVSKSGKGIGGVQVSLIESDGNIRHARTNYFGYYRFNGVPIGQTILIQGRTKFFLSVSQVATLVEDLELNFVF